MPEIPEKYRAMLAQIRTKTVHCWVCVKRRIVPAEGLGAQDMALLRWGALCMAVLLPVGVLQMADCFSGMEAWQAELLQGHPFYMPEAETGTALLGRGGLFALGVAATMYLAVVLLHERSAARRAQVCVLALMALALPGLVCALWHGVFHAAPPMLCVVLLWVYTCFPFFQPAEDQAS